MSENLLTLELVDHQRDLASTTRRFLQSHAAVADARALMTRRPNYDPSVFRQLGEDLGLQGLRVPEEYGGAGAGFVEVGIVMQELGRVLYPGPYLATITAIETLLATSDMAAMEDLLPAMAAGQVVATVAVAESFGPPRQGDVRVRAGRAQEHWTLTGHKHLVINGDTADVFLVAAAGDQGVSLFVVEGAGEGVTRRTRETLDQTRALADLELREAPARLIGDAGTAWTAIEAGYDRACIALAAETLGTAEQALQTTVQYAKDRHQFGRPIGSFQALKHRLADLAMVVELARCSVDYATHAVDAGDSDHELRSASAIALSCTATAAQQVAGECIQIHGGIGFTWEHDAHLYFKRARANAALLGSVNQQQERLLQSIGV